MWKLTSNPKYEVSDSGQVRNVTDGKVLRPTVDKQGYYRVSFNNNGISTDNVEVHRLVAEAFVPNPNRLPYVNHKDENKLNNNASNLEWCTVNYNNAYGNRVAKGVMTKKRNKLLNGI